MLPEIGTPEWDAEVKFYQHSTLKQRVKRAKELGYKNKDTYQTVMARHGVHLEYDIPPLTSDYQLPPDSSWEEHLEIISAMSKLVAFHQEVPNEINIEIDTDKPIAVTFTSDWQLGQFGVDYKAFGRDVKFLCETPGFYHHIGGDGYQNIIQASKIGSSQNQTPVSVQKGLYYLTIKKMSGNNLTIGTGNHNYWSAMATGEDWDGELTKRLKLLYIKHYGLVHLKVGKFTYPYLVIHEGRFNSSFNLTHTCKQYQRLHFPKARIVVVEHHHVSSVESYRYDGRECIAMRPGTYAVYDDFAQQHGFFGAHVANPSVVLFPNKDKICGFKDMRDAGVYLAAVRK